MHRIWLILATCSMLLAATGCTARYVRKDAFPQAVPVTPEMLEEISREIFDGTGTDTEPAESESAPAEILDPLAEDSIVYWLAGGKVCHASITCRYVKDREDVLSGTFAEARDEGKEKVCSVCCPAS